MIRLTVMLAVAFLAYNVASAQAPQNHKGPESKNVKPWKNQKRTATIVVGDEEFQIKGPVYKNEKNWKHQRNRVLLSLDTVKKEQVTGPNAKNRKAWKK